MKMKNLVCVLLLSFGFTFVFSVEDGVLDEQESKRRELERVQQKGNEFVAEGEAGFQLYALIDLPVDQHFQRLYKYAQETQVEVGNTGKMLDSIINPELRSDAVTAFLETAETSDMMLQNLYDWIQNRFECCSNKKFKDSLVNIQVAILAAQTDLLETNKFIKDNESALKDSQVSGTGTLIDSIRSLAEQKLFLQNMSIAVDKIKNLIPKTSFFAKLLGCTCAPKVN